MAVGQVVLGGLSGGWGSLVSDAGRGSGVAKAEARAVQQPGHATFRVRLKNCRGTAAQFPHSLPQSCKWSSHGEVLVAPMFRRTRSDARAAAPPAEVFPLPQLPAVPAGDVLTRKDLRELSPAEQDRFCDAVERMMEPGWAATTSSPVASGKFVSEYFRLASERTRHGACTRWHTYMTGCSTVAQHSAEAKMPPLMMVVVMHAPKQQQAGGATLHSTQLKAGRHRSTRVGRGFARREGTGISRRTLVLAVARLATALRTVPAVGAEGWQLEAHPTRCTPRSAHALPTACRLPRVAGEAYGGPHASIRVHRTPSRAQRLPRLAGQQPLYRYASKAARACVC